MRRITGEGSWIMDPNFATLVFHSFALEERLSSSISKEQLALPSVSSDVSLCACGVGDLSHACDRGPACQPGQGVGICESDVCQGYMPD